MLPTIEGKESSLQKVRLCLFIFIAVVFSPSSAQALDLDATGAEVTQAIQNLDNTVTLVTGKKTYVRFYVQTSGSPSDVSGVTATLTGYRLSDAVPNLGVITPENASGTIAVKASPDRDNINDSFFFKLPSSWTHGYVLLTAKVDPDNAIEETNESNNIFLAVANFKSVPTLRLKIYNVAYPIGSATVTPGPGDLVLLVSWLKRAYPIHKMKVDVGTINFSSRPARCDDVNTVLWIMRVMNQLLDFSFSSKTRYYGMVHDNNDPNNYFMRGCASDIPSHVASGPTGSPTAWFPWDTDSSYGDWYGAHELAHTYGRCHAEFCGAAGGCDDQTYPYTNGNISTGDFYGFDVGYGPGLFGTLSPQVLPPGTWTDVMTYCNYQWMSDFTYQGLFDFLNNESSLSASASGSGQGTKKRKAQKYILIEGRVNNFENVSAKIGDIYQLESKMSLSRSKPGDFSIRFFDQDNKLLQQFDITPQKDTDDSMLAPLDAKSGPPQVGGTIIEVLPFNVQTKRVAIWYKETELDSRKVSTKSPQVNMIYPKGGEILSGVVTVRWQATDENTDPLAATLLYSSNNGKHWTAIDTKIKASSYKVDLDEFRPGGKCLFRILVSDGFNTASDQTDKPFRVKKSKK